MKIIENLQESEKILQKTAHLLYIAFPVINDKRFLINIIKEIKKAIANCINSILQFEYISKRVNLTQNPETNFKNFKEKSAKYYEITSEEIKIISELFNLIEYQKKSSMEFVRGEKVIIISNGMEPKTLTVEKTKEFLQTGKNILEKTKNKILRKI